MRMLTTGLCAAFTPRMFVVNHAGGETLDPRVANLLDPVDTATLHHWDLKRENATELHYHEHDEYWLWTRGSTSLTVRLPDGRSESLTIGAGWVVYCVRGVEHGHTPREDWACYELTSRLREGARTGHLRR